MPTGTWAWHPRHLVRGAHPTGTFPKFLSTWGGCIGGGGVSGYLSTTIRVAAAYAADVHVVCQRANLESAHAAPIAVAPVFGRDWVAGKADSRVQLAADDRAFDELVDVCEEEPRDVGRYSGRAGAA